MAGINDLIAKLDALNTDEWRMALSRQLAEEALDLIDDGFKRRSNPYGDRWTQTKQPNPILEKSGNLRASFRIIATAPSGFSIRSDSEYGHFHQYGTTHAARTSLKTKETFAERGLSVRALVPTDAGGMPAAYERAFDAVLVRYVKETMR